MAKWNGEEVSQAEYRRLWGLANPEKVKEHHRAYVERRRKAHEPEVVHFSAFYDLPKKESQRYRDAFESGSWRRKKEA